MVDFDFGSFSDFIRRLKSSIWDRLNIYLNKNDLVFVGFFQLNKKQFGTGLFINETYFEWRSENYGIER